MITTALLVEDNKFFLDSFTDALRTYLPLLRIEVAHDGEQALELMQHCKPEIVFMDVKLAGESGFELTRKVKKVYPSARVIMLTALAPEAEYLAAARAAGASDFVVKGSLSMEEIVDLITRERI
ncbi:MAG TPA: response regulator [Thermodesulfobacteriota bacterium]|nr:response regulator [Deltaproteobacteria bacterium]HNR12618.1 response regulator [Thermodesulfobacteriota bacterium]HNU71754.1 response regulator [Thermodesulfobacteriota bacterium]